MRTEAAAVTVSPGQQAEELRQAAQKAKRAGATADALKPLVDAEREARARQAAAKSSKPLDMARTAVEQAAAAVTAADAACSQSSIQHTFGTIMSTSVQVAGNSNIFALFNSSLMLPVFCLVTI